MVPRLLLLQARYADDPARREERQSFADRLGLPLEAIVPHDLLTGPPRLEHILEYDALLIGGAGNFDVTKRNLPAFEETLERLREVVEVGHPTFASCFGFQLMVEALGGKIIRDEANMEVGTFQVYLTEEGKSDELFRILPPVFWAQLGHKERAERLPDGVVNLAYSERAPYQAFRVPGKLIWATQFHPELTVEENRIRFRRYLDVYQAHLSPEEIEALLESFRPSPETERLLPHFLSLVLGEGVGIPPR
ncbi:MAG: type 1 glutamine amidotransferase [Chloroflexi bacterium]|nr:type 1 glutamine amidotransferase [Chloroflexota bacterium]